MRTLFLILAFLVSTNYTLSQVSKKAIWQNNSVELKDCTPNSDLSDLYALNKEIGDSKVVAIGETTHGTHEIFTMKHKLIKYLIKEKGFNFIAFESNKPETELINAYIKGGEGNPKELLKGIYFWTWNTQEILDLIIWLRAYNVSNKKQVQLVGIDMQYNYQAIKNLKSYFSLNADITSLLTSVELMYKENKSTKLNYKELDALIEKLNLKINRELSLESNLKKKESIQENLKIITQSAFLDKTQSTVYRDESMANYVMDYLNKSEENKVIVWAHNMHISKDEFWKMGYHLKKHLKSDYYAIGFSISEGTFTAKDYQNKVRQNHKLKANPKTSIEYKFEKIGKPIFFISTKHLSLDSWFLKRRKFRDIGASLWGSEFIKVRLVECYDGIIFIKHTTASQILN